MSLILKIFFVFFVYGSFASIGVNKLEEFSFDEGQESPTLELERILNSYALLVEKEIFFGIPDLSPNQIPKEVLDYILNPNEIFISKKLSEEYLYQKFQEIHKKEKNYLQKEKEFKKFLNFYHFLHNLKAHFQTLKESQAKISESFSNFNTVVIQNNQMDKLIEELNERYKSLEYKKGRLNFMEIENLIEWNRKKDIFSNKASLKTILKETTASIQSLYAQIDSEKQRLFNLENPIADILCGSDFYKSVIIGCFPVFDLKNKEQLALFIDSLSPEKWRNLDRKTQKIRLKKKASLKEILWQSAQSRDLNEIKALFKSTDFFRWIYFQLREELKAGADPDSAFSWGLIFKKLEEERKEKQIIELEFILLFSNKIELEQKTLFYSNEMEEKEKEFLEFLIEVEDFISFESYDIKTKLEKAGISCLKSELKMDFQWSICINEYFSFLLSQEDKKDQWEKDLNKSLRELVLKAFSLKRQIENQPLNRRF